MWILIGCLLALTALIWLIRRRTAKSAAPEAQAQKWRTLRERGHSESAVSNVFGQPSHPAPSAERTPTGQGGSHPRVEIQMSEVEEDDERYAAFVREMWERPGVDLKGIRVRRVSRRSETECALISLVTGPRGETYVNVLEDGANRTYAADDRHRWRRDGDLFSSSAFEAVLGGADPETELTHAAHPDFLEHPLPPIGALSGLVYGIEYGDSQGEVTSRVLRLADVTREGGDLLISGHCYLRNAARTFRANRIVGLTDHRTGKMIECPFEHFEQFVSGNSLTHPDHARAFKRAKPGLTALLWAARADPGEGEKYQDALLAFAAERLQLDPRTKLPATAFDQDLFRYWCRRRRPTGAEAAHAVIRMWERGKEVRLVCAHLERLAAIGSEPIRKRAQKLLGEANV